MPAYKNDNGTWYVSFYYRDMSGNNTKKKKTGFETRREALNWERQFLAERSGAIEMTFGEFVEVYKKDMMPRLRVNTWVTKEHVIDQKILPYFENKIVSEISPADIIHWQNIMMKEKSKRGGKYSETYLRTIQNQLSAILNHAVRLYDLNYNPVRKAGPLGKTKSNGMKVWTKEEFLLFANATKENPHVYYSFQILYWCGLRVGELFALTGNDFDFNAGTISITKSYQRINRQDIITPPKTEKSIRTVAMPGFLITELQRYFRSLKRKFGPRKRIFTMSHNYLLTELGKYADIAGVPQIRIHDLRHSHVSLLISLGFNAVDIAERLGHESIDITLHYAHMFPTKQKEMAERLNLELKEAV